MISIREEMNPLKREAYLQHCITRLVDFNDRNHLSRKLIQIHFYSCRLILVIFIIRLIIYYIGPLDDFERITLFDSIHILGLDCAENGLEALLYCIYYLIHSMLYSNYYCKFQQILQLIICKQNYRIFPQATFRKQQAAYFIKQTALKAVQFFQLFSVAFGLCQYFLFDLFL